jgi:hypothetical protein
MSAGQHGVGGEPLHSHGGYPQRPLPVGFSDSQQPQSHRRNTRHVLQEAKGAWGLNAEAEMG